MPKESKSRIDTYIEKAFFTLVLAVLSFTASTIKEMYHEIRRLSSSITLIMDTLQAQTIEIDKMRGLRETVIRLEEQGKVREVRISNLEDHLGIRYKKTEKSAN